MGLNPICESIYLFRAQFAKRLFPKCLVSASKYPEREKQNTQPRAGMAPAAQPPNQAPRPALTRGGRAVRGTWGKQLLREQNSAGDSENSRRRSRRGRLGFAWEWRRRRLWRTWPCLSRRTETRLTPPAAGKRRSHGDGLRPGHARPAHAVAWPSVLSQANVPGQRTAPRELAVPGRQACADPHGRAHQRTRVITDTRVPAQRHGRAHRNAYT